jgi:hypothetical protein
MIIEKYTEDLGKYINMVHEATEGRYNLTGYDLCVIEAGLQQLSDINKSDTNFRQIFCVPIPIGIQRRRTKGWKMPLNTISVTRPGKFGNPYKIGDHNVWDIKDKITRKSLKDVLLERNGENVYRTNQDLVDAFREKVKASEAFQRIIKRELRGKNLACFCPIDKPCHRSVLLEFANL